MAALDRNAARALMARDALTEEQLANLAGVSVSHVKRVLECRESPADALARLIHAQIAPVASIAPPSPIAAALAVVQEAMQCEAEKSRDVARDVTSAANAYARVVEESIAHGMLASVGRAKGSAPDVHGAALALVSCVQRIPELASLFASPAPVSAPPPIDAIAGDSPANAEPETPAQEPVIAAPVAPVAHALPWPSLALATKRRPVVIVGGTPIPATIEWLRGDGLVVEWDEVTKGGSDRVVQSIARRVAHGSLSAIVFVQGFLLHKHSESIRKAATDARLPYGYAGTGGKAGMRAALDKIESEIRARRAA